MNTSSKIAMALAGGILLGGVVTRLAVTTDTPDPVATTVTVTQTPAPVPSGPPLVVGNYTFDILGGNKSQVRLEDCGPDCLVLSTAPTEANPGGFTQPMTRSDNRYVGQSFSERGVVCAADKQPRPAETRYSVDIDGTDGLVEVLDQPCGPDAPNVPLKFTLVPVA